MQISVRAVETRDANAIAQIESACFSDAWQQESVLASIQRRDFCGVCAEIDGQMVAYLCGSVLFEDAEVLRVAVAPAHRKKGYGAAVMDAFLQQAQSQGATRVFLEVRESNQAAIGLYLSRGFEKTRIRENYYDGKENAVEMLKTL